MKIVVPKERRAGESRVAATPETARKLIALGFDVTVESGAGAGANILDQDYAEAGATIADQIEGALGEADIVLKVLRPGASNGNGRGNGEGLDETTAMKKGALLIGMLSPLEDLPQVEAYAKKGIDAFSLEFLPRITRAQGMDVLSSQANLAGYKSVLDAAAEFGRAALGPPLGNPNV